MITNDLFNLKIFWFFGSVENIEFHDMFINRFKQYYNKNSNHNNFIE